jgi:sulfite exporter TauE/SafE
MSSTLLGIVLGVLVGLRHAFEPDHLTAVSTLVSETHSPRHGVLLGVLWGLGHTISLAAVGVILALVGATLPARIGIAFELGVAVMLLLLGARAIAVASRGEPRFVRAHPHVHRHPHLHVHRAARRGRWRPLVVGLVHGLAGSGALTALVFAQLQGTAARILYMVLFGAGSIVGMAIASGVAGVALQLVARSSDTRRRVGIATGIVSIGVGLLWGIPLLAAFGASSGS